MSVDAAELTIGALRNAAEGACVVRRFPSAAEAWRWVDAGTARSLLDVVCWVPSELVKSVTYPRMTASTTLVNVDDDARLAVLATRPASSASTPASSKSSTPTVSRFECHASSLASTARSLSLSASSMPPSALYPTSGRVSVPTALGFKGRPDMTAARNGPPARTTSRWTRGIGQASQGTQFAASAPLARQAADQGRPGGTGSRKTVQQFSFRPLGRPSRGQQRLSPLPARPGRSRPSAGALPSVPPVAQEVAVGVATLSPTGSIEKGKFDDDAWERELDEVSDLVDVVIRRAESAETAEARPVKRAKVSNVLPGEVPSALNPPSSSKDRTSGMFTLAEIRRFMAEHDAMWKQQQVSYREPAARRWGPHAPFRKERSTTILHPPASAAGSRLSGDSRPPLDDQTGLAGLLTITLSEGHLSLPSGAVDDATVPRAMGDIGRLASAGAWDAVCCRLLDRGASAFVSGGPGVAKSTLLKQLHAVCKSRFAADGEVVVLAPTGTSAKTAGGVTYHSFFGFGREFKPVEVDAAAEARCLLSTNRFGPIKQRLARARVVLLDEISLVSAVNLDMMCHLLRHARSLSAPPCLWFAFGDFLQLRPVCGAWAFTAKTWSSLFGDVLLELTTIYRQRDRDYVRAIQDARLGACSEAVLQLVKDREVDEPQYNATKTDVMHLMPLHKEVVAHSRSCLEQVCAGLPPTVSFAVDSVAVDIDREMGLPRPNLESVSVGTRNAALSACVAPKVVFHCHHAHVMMTSNRMMHVGVCHGSAGVIVAYQSDGAAVVRFENHPPPAGAERSQSGLLNSGDTWIELACPPVEFLARIFSLPGAVAVRMQVPFVLGWACTVHMSQSLTLPSAILDLRAAFEAGMVHTALRRVSDNKRLYIKSFVASRLFADELAMSKYKNWRRL